MLATASTPREIGNRSIQNNMNTHDIMNLALSLADLKEVPADSGIFRPADDVRSVLYGIDINEGDLRSAKEQGCDLVISHHPFDEALFISMMPRHSDLMLQYGVSPDLARKATECAMRPYQDWAAGLPVRNRSSEMMAVANELGIGLMTIHNPSDELGRHLLTKLASECEPSRTVADLMSAYAAVPEMSNSDEEVELLCGRPTSAVGRCAVIHAAGTSGGFPVADALFHSGIQTVVYIHVLSLRERALIAERGSGNLITTGHYCSDSLGINPLINMLERKGVRVDICNHLIRP